MKKPHVKYRVPKIRITADFLSKIMQARKWSIIIFKVLKKPCEFRIL